MVTLVDTNVIVDVLQDDPRWAAWSADRLSDAGMAGDVIVNVVVVGELSRDYLDLTTLRGALDRLHVSIRSLDDEAAFLAGKRFVAARAARTDTAPARPLPDFFIGAHAVTLGALLLTRDPTLYRRYFPDLTLITPETHADG